MVKQNEGGAVLQTPTDAQEGKAENSLHTIVGTQVLELERELLISLTEAMRIISPQSSNAARWFTQRQELFKKDVDFVYSDTRFPGKVGRIWIKVPEGLMTLVQVGKEAIRLKIPEDLEERLVLFLDGIQDSLYSTSSPMEGASPMEGESKKAGKQENEQKTDFLTQYEPEGDDLEIEFETAKEQVGMGAKEQGSKGQVSRGAGEQKAHPLISPAQLDPVLPLRPLAVKRPTLEDVSKAMLRTKGSVQTPTDAPEGLPQTTTDAPKGLWFSAPWSEVLPKLVECVSEFSQQYHQKFVTMNKIMNEAPEEIYNILEDAEKRLQEKMVMNHLDRIKDILSGIISPETQ